MLEYTQSVNIKNNVTKLETLSYVQANKKNVEDTKYNNVFLIITTTTFVITIISISGKEYTPKYSEIVTINLIST